MKIFVGFLLLLVAELNFNSAFPSPSKNAICTSKPSDVIFVLDSSGSIREYDFRRQIKFVIDVIAQLPVGQDLVRIGVVSFSNWAQLEFHLKDYGTVAEMEKALHSMVQMRGDTNTASALAFVRDVMLTPEHGSRPEVPHVVVVLTDGKSNNPMQTAVEAARTKAQANAQVFAIGVGKEVDDQELYNIASRPANQHIFTVKSYNALGTIKERLAIKTCLVTNQLTIKPLLNQSTIKPLLNQPTTKPLLNQLTTKPLLNQPTVKPLLNQLTLQVPATVDPFVQVDQACGVGVAADILFAGSPQANEDATIKTMKFFRDIASNLDIGPSKVHIGLVPKDCDYVPEIALHQFRKGSLHQMTQRKAPSTASVLRYINDIGFVPRRGGRQHVKKTGVLFIDGSLDVTNEAVKEAIRAKEQHNIELFVVGVGKDIQPKDLNAIASSPSETHVFHVASYDELPSILDAVTSSICPVSSL